MDADSPDDGRLEILEHLLDLSKSVDGCARLTSVLRRLAFSPAHLLLACFRLERNLCSDIPANQDAFLASGGPDPVASVLIADRISRPKSFLRCLRFLICCHRREARRAAVWARFFPYWFREMAGRAL